MEVSSCNINKKPMKRIGVFGGIVVLAFALAGCNNGSQQKIAQMQSSIDSLTAESEQKTQTINEFFASISAIEESLAEVKNKEKAIGSNVQNYEGGELPSDVRERINEDIVAINDIMASNRQKIARLSATLKNSNIKTAELQRIIESTEQKLNERDSTVLLLKTQLETLNFSVDSLNMVVDTLSASNEELAELVASKDAKLNEAWFAIGKRSELIENKVLENRVLRKNLRLRRDFNQGYFTKIVINDTDEIPLYANTDDVTVVTSHPQQSYTLRTDEKGNVQALVITDKESFWSTSRYLVVVVK